MPEVELAVVSSDALARTEAPWQAAAAARRIAGCRRRCAASESLRPLRRACSAKSGSNWQIVGMATVRLLGPAPGLALCRNARAPATPASCSQTMTSPIQLACLQLRRDWPCSNGQTQACP